jgi:hypothetical protein
VEVRSCAVKNRAVSNRNCVAAMRGGEQRNENDQSVTLVARWAIAVNSIRSAWVGESASVRRSLSGRAKSAGNRVVPGRRADGWRRNGRKSSCNNQGDPPVPVDALGKQSAHLAGGSQSVRSSDEAGNDRGAKGTQESGSMTNRTTDKEPKRVPVRAYRRRSQPSVIGLVDTESLCVILRDEAKSRSLSTEHPLTGKPDAGNPPVRFGGRGGANLAIPTPIPN